MPSRHRLTATLACALALLLAFVTPAHASFQSDVAGLVNAARSQQGLAELTPNSDIDGVAQAWAEHLAEVGELSHNPDYGSQIPAGASGAAENVAYNSAPSPGAMHGQLMDSSGHRANILGDYTHIGVGYATDADGGGWLVEVFGRYPGALPGDRGTAPPTTEPSPEPSPSASPSEPAPAPTTAPEPSESPATPEIPEGWLALGAVGSEVMSLQEDLAALGYELAADGSFGESTRAQVLAFQRDADLQPDGLVGPATLEAIDDALGLTATEPPTETEEPTGTEAPPSGTAEPTGEATFTGTPDIVPTDAAARPPGGTSSIGPSTGALVGTLGGATLALAALLVIRRRIVAEPRRPRHL